MGGVVIIREHSGFGHGENSRVIDMNKLVNVERMFIKVQKGVHQSSAYLFLFPNTRGILYINGFSHLISVSSHPVPQTPCLSREPSTAVSCDSGMCPKI